MPHDSPFFIASLIGLAISLQSFGESSAAARDEGNVIIVVHPPHASWQITHGDDEIIQGAGPRTVSGVAFGTVTVRWNDLTNYEAPLPREEMRTLGPERAEQFSQIYLPAWNPSARVATLVMRHLLGLDADSTGLDINQDQSVDIADLLSGRAGPCPNPLSADALTSLAFPGFGIGPHDFGLHPGETRHLALGLFQCCYSFQQLPVCATFSIMPSEGAWIDPDSGYFSVDSATPAGTVYQISANVENGRRILTKDLHVYTPESNPLVGIWRESLQYACQSGTSFVPEDTIQEMTFLPNGRFLVTWFPFEIYVDYWGRYDFDIATGEILMQIEFGNYIPDYVDLDGSFRIEDGDLILEGMWLGAPPGGTIFPIACGHRFE